MQDCEYSRFLHIKDLIIGEDLKIAAEIARGINFLFFSDNCLFMFTSTRVPLFPYFLPPERPFERGLGQKFGRVHSHKSPARDLASAVNMHFIAEARVG